MRRKLILVFVISFIAFGTLSLLLGEWKNDQQEAELRAESQLLHQTVKENIQFNLEHIKDVSLMAAGYFATENMDERRYQKMGSSLLTVYKELLGLNILNAEGIITRVYPYEENKEALNKTSQNLVELQNSRRLNQKYWLSPPFVLYQNGLGFVFYTAINDKDFFKGWVGIVLSYERFFKGIQLERYLSKYHLILEDASTNKPFFATTNVKPQNRYSHQSDPDFFGRKVHFISFPRKEPFNFKPSFLICLILSTLFASLSTYAFKQKWKNRENKQKLAHVNELLMLTTSEASHVVTAVNDEVNSSNSLDLIKNNITGYILYLGNLLEQLTVTNSLSKVSLLSDLTDLEIFTLIEEQLNFMKSLQERKKVHINFLETKEEKWIRGHKWLLSHSGFGNVIRYLINLAEDGSELKITSMKDENQTLLSFHIDGSLNSKQSNPMQEMLERSLIVAKEVFIIHQIEMDILIRPRELVIALHFPA